MQDLMPPINTQDSIFHDGDPTTGQLGTIVTALWLNNVQAATRDVQAEIKNVLAKAGMTPDPKKNNQLADAISQIVSSGNYASTAYVDNGLNKKIDKANISGVKGNDNDKVPSLNLFTFEIGKLQPKGDYQEAGYSYSKEESNNNFQHKGNYATKEELNSGLDLKLSKDSIEQSPGVATNKVMSQAGATNNFTSRENFSTGSSDAWMRTPNKSGVIQITDVGEFNFLHNSNYAFSVSSDGEISNGRINASKVTGLFSKYTDVTSQRSVGVNYTNPVNKPMFVNISFGNTNGNLIVTVNGIVVYNTGNTSDGITRMSASFIVPPGGTYKVESPAGFNLWSECA